jgi:hypothetical protein
MQAGELLLTRHAEKPDDPLDADLSPRGLQRAAKLVGYIQDEFSKPASQVDDLAICRGQERLHRLFQSKPDGRNLSRCASLTSIPRSGASPPQ